MSGSTAWSCEINLRCTARDLVPTGMRGIYVLLVVLSTNTRVRKGHITLSFLFDFYPQSPLNCHKYSSAEHFVLCSGPSSVYCSNEINGIGNRDYVHSVHLSTKSELIKFCKDYLFKQMNRTELIFR